MFNIWWFMKKRQISYIGTTASSLSVARFNLAATTVGNYALFGGGHTGSASNVVDVYRVF